MPFLLVCFWTFGIMLLWFGRKNEMLFWLGVLNLVGGCLVFVNVLREDIVPLLKEAKITGLLVYVPLIDRFFDLVGMVLSPYSFLQYCLVSSHLFIKRKVLLHFIFLLPPLVIVFLAPPVPQDIDSSLIFKINSIVTIIYTLLATFFLGYSFHIEKNLKNRKLLFLIMIMSLPVFYFIIIINYIKYFFGNYQCSPLIIAVLIYIILIFIFSVRYGILGITIKIDHDPFDDKIRMMTSGFLNHSLKNEINKIAILADTIGRTDDIAEIRENTGHILSSAVQMREMINRINLRIQGITLNETHCDMVKLIEESLNEMTSSIGAKNITIHRSFDCLVTYKCDRVHIKEVLANILQNAVEAIGATGEIYIRLYENRSYLILEIEDTGKGIAKEELAQVGEPFWTTKGNLRNTGLGLTYCRQIMQYYGILTICSELNKGTKVTLKFTNKKYSGKLVNEVRRVSYGEN